MAVTRLKNGRDDSIADIAKKVHKNAVEHGWWDKERLVPELLCLIHSEVSEALEAYRNSNIEGMAEELADIVIRVFDMAEGMGIDIQTEIIEKHMINKKRTYRHGGKMC